MSNMVDDRNAGYKYICIFYFFCAYQVTLLATQSNTNLWSSWELCSSCEEHYLWKNICVVCSKSDFNFLECYLGGRLHIIRFSNVLVGCVWSLRLNLVLSVKNFFFHSTARHLAFLNAKMHSAWHSHRSVFA